MKIIETEIGGVLIIELEPKTDWRGHFVRAFCANELKRAGVDFDIVQTNQSFTKKQGVIRGLHFLREPKSENKIFQCLSGLVFDVTVDLRPKSPTYKKWLGMELNREDHRLLFISPGIAHGFQTLTNNCLVQYHTSEFYSPDFDSGVRWDDPALGIKWPIASPQITEKDSNWALL